MQKLIRKCRDYDRKAQRQMVDLLTPKLTPICYRYVAGDLEFAKDLLQESLVKIFNNINKFDLRTDAEFVGWCRKITINTAISIMKKRRLIVRELKQEDIVVDNSFDILDQLRAKDILALIENLPAQHRTVFNLFVLDGYSHKEIGKAMDIKESSSRVFLTRAKARMVELLADQDIFQSVRKRG